MTLQERIDVALPNESILVEPGVYAGRVNDQQTAHS